jgi:large repetitive protein
LQGDLLFSGATVDDSTHSCDNDGKLDSGEAGVLKLSLRNSGWATLTRSQVKVTSSDPNLTLDNGGIAQLGPLEPYAEVTASIGVSARAGVARRGVLQMTLTPSDPDALTPTADVPLALSYNYDNALDASASDDMESDQSAWSAVDNLLPKVWSRDGDPNNHVWHGDDTGATGDESLVSPDLKVSAFNPLIISFKHRYSFEVGPVTEDGPDVPFDGGVLEISQDGGKTWQDVSSYAYTTYGAALYRSPLDAGAPDAGSDEIDTNPLAGRRAWDGESVGYPNFTNTSINLGLFFARKTVKIRFRIGTDQGTGAPGWDIDDVSFGAGAYFSGITNTPFSKVVDDATSCSQ